MEALFPSVSHRTETSLSDRLPLPTTTRFTEWPDEEGSSADKFSDLDLDICPNCETRDNFDEADSLTCMSCGYVIMRTFDNSAEYRYFANDDRGADPTRVGAPQDPLLPQASLGTVILGNKGTKSMYKVRKYHSWNTVPYKERSIIQAHERLNLIGLNHGINQSAIEQVRSMYITLQEIGGRQGLSRDAMLAGCMYLVLKQTGSPRKPKEIADYFGISSAIFTKALKQMQELLAQARQRGEITTTKAKIQNASTRATEYIELPLSKLPLSRTQMDTMRLICMRLAEKATEAGLGQENMPPSLAAGCIAFIFKRSEVLEIPLQRIAEVCEISLATLQKCLRRLEQHAEELEECFGKSPLVAGAVGGAGASASK
jgi:transcription initiation factor TFIIB